jgi:BirA family biotin operon repressor/biotin-[acetyl-CoA-carboxylase] ligase
MLPPGYRLLAYDSIGSTNDEAKRLARDGAAEGTLLWALEQTAGRGRRGRAWVSPPGNLYASLILRPDCSVGQAAQLGFVAALAVGGALRALCPTLGATYKWPNDVLANGRKIAGILLESEVIRAGGLSFLVLGVGVNLIASPQGTEFPATSIVEEGLRPIPPQVMLEEFAGQFHSWKMRWQCEGFAPIRAAWLAAALSRGGPIRVRLASDCLQGDFVDIDGEGALLLEVAGERRRVAAGEVFLISR